MPKTVFSATELKEYFGGQFKSAINDRAKDIEAAVRIHADGLFPEKLISDARPHESQEVLEYRKKIWKPKTKPVFTKIFNSLSKIRRSSDWTLNWPDQPFPKIPDDETLQKYVDEKLPYFDSLTNWAFQVLLREYLIDPNGIIIVKPLETEIVETAFLQPIPSVINSNLIIDFKEEDFCVFINEVGSTYYEQGMRFVGKSFYIFTTLQILKYDQVDSKERYQLTMAYNHNLGELPAYKIGAVLIDNIGDNFLYESRITGAIPSLDEAAREYSDLQASVVMHIYPERWEFATVICSECGGIGKIPDQTAATGQVVCPKCKGLGAEVNSPFSKLLIKTPEIGQQQAAVPPAGYVEKDIAIVKLQDERYEKHVYDALSSVNMEFLAQTPLNQSGVAKEVDKDETNNFVHSVAEDIVRSLDWIIWIIALMRYQTQYDKDAIKEMTPEIPVPEHFDIFSTKYIEDELKNAKDNKFNPVLINAMEINYATKKFGTDPEVQKKLLVILQLDPLANISEDDKVARLTNKGVTLEDYVLSSNIFSIVNKAVEEDENFLSLDVIKQREVVMKYVEEIIAENDTGSELATDFLGQGGLNEPPAPGSNGQGNGLPMMNNGQPLNEPAAATA